MSTKSNLGLAVLVTAVLTSAAFGQTSQDVLSDVVISGAGGFRLEAEAVLTTHNGADTCASLSASEVSGDPYSWGTASGTKETVDCVTVQYAITNATSPSEFSGTLNCDSHSTSDYYECVAILADASGKQLWGANFRETTGYREVFTQAPSTSFTTPLTLTIYAFIDTQTPSLPQALGQTTVYVPGGYRIETEQFSALATGGSCANFTTGQQPCSGDTRCGYSLGTTTTPMTTDDCIFATFSTVPSGSGVFKGNLQCGSQNSAYYECVAVLQDTNGKQLWSDIIRNTNTYAQEIVYAPSVSFTSPITMYVYTFPDSATAP
ncbi:MAG TPA: hypothetical protein VG204_19420 [Terriglobia bacterium]|nr:hypothetical protein [Terriglobia bacterium]